MKKPAWKSKLPAADAFRRASGRRRHNAERARQAWFRRIKLVRLLSMKGALPHGQQKQIAALWGVSRATISRDYAVAVQMTGGMIGGGVMPRVGFSGARPVFTWTFHG